MRTPAQILEEVVEAALSYDNEFGNQCVQHQMEQIMGATTTKEITIEFTKDKNELEGP